MSFDYQHLKSAAFSGILFMSVYHVISSILQSAFLVSFFFLFNCVLSTLALLAVNKPKIDHVKLTLSVMLLSSFSLYIFLLSHLDTPNATSIWFCIIILCNSVLLSSSLAFRLNLSIIISYWLIIVLLSNKSLLHIESALTLTLITLLISMLGQVTRNLVNQLELSIKTDTLTGCIQTDEFKLELAKVTQLFDRYNTPFSLICIKYDSAFPSESEFEIWIKELAQLYQSRLRKTDILCRFNSQKFMILLPSTPHKNAETLCSDLKKCADAYEFSYQKAANPHNINTRLTFVTETYTDKDTLEDWFQKLQSK